MDRSAASLVLNLKRKECNEVESPPGVANSRLAAHTRGKSTAAAVSRRRLVFVYYFVHMSKPDDQKMSRVGQNRALKPKRLSSDGVTAAIMACMSPEHTIKKFRSKSVSGRKVTLSPERGLEGPAEAFIDLPVLKQVQRGGAMFARRSCTSFRQ
ncbi:hypothetical protein NDU88_004219 [Pleurodeles waltl]|uniref:Uncharacterized protein n=1 Tax=Pleurodeles waltl TaxID=8319 RepID=A0AAV7T718_PLEWA|nr:hypothetical protein NDU88_004219 [Pleurodeles waltl]